MPTTAPIAELARWLTDQQVPTRTGKHRWDRSVVWGMLRNPAYAGRAVFGKTMVVPEPPGLNRTARLQGRSVPRAHKTVDRPRQQWTEIPVPAIVDEDTFDRVAQRLADNKRFASRNAKVPSLLQGLAACSCCGYGYYRTCTRTTNKKIYYYRCLGSDDYRYEGGRVCTNKPVRADHLDTVVWDHVTRLLADPQLIRTEIDRRLDSSRTANPVVQQRKRLDTALVKASNSIAAMIEAFGEQLITIDELRVRMPDLRARETNLRNQIQALDNQAADREAYLKLACDLEGFLTQLRTNAQTSTVEERQRVLRLLVKDVLVGPDKITIRHRIPIRARATDNAKPTADADTEDDHAEHCPLRWGRGDAALRRPGVSVLAVADLGEDASLEERLDQTQYPLVFDPATHAVHQGHVVDRVKARLDIRIQHPAIPLGAVLVYLGDCVVGSPHRPEPIGDRHEVGLEDRFQHQLQRSLNHPIGHGGDAKLPQLPRPSRFGDLTFPHRLWSKHALPELSA